MRQTIHIVTHYNTGTISTADITVRGTSFVVDASTAIAKEVTQAMQKSLRDGYKEEVRSMLITFDDKKRE